MVLNMEKELGEKIKMISRVINMLVNIYMIKRMVMENSFGNLAIIIKDIIKMMKDTDMVKCFLQTEQYIKEIGHEDYKVVKVH